MNHYLFIIVFDEQKEHFDIYLSYNALEENSSCTLDEEETSNDMPSIINEQITNIILRQLMESYFLKCIDSLLPFIPFIFWPD